MRVRPLFVLALFLGAAIFSAPLHALVPADGHESHTPCTDGVPVPHVDSCEYDSERGACHLCVHSAGGLSLSVPGPLDTPGASPVPAILEANFGGHRLALLPGSRAPPAPAH